MKDFKSKISLPHNIDSDSFARYEKDLLHRSLVRFIEECNLKYNSITDYNKFDGDNLVEVQESEPIGFTIEKYKRNTNGYNGRDEIELGVTISPIPIEKMVMKFITRKEQISSPEYNSKLTWKERITALLKGDLYGGDFEVVEEENK